MKIPEGVSHGVYCNGIEGREKGKGEEVREGYKDIPIFIFHLKGCVEEGRKWWGAQDIPSHRCDFSLPRGSKTVLPWEPLCVYACIPSRMNRLMYSTLVQNLV